MKLHNWPNCTAPNVSSIMSTVPQPLFFYFQMPPETIYTALHTIADAEDFGDQDEDAQYALLMEAINQSQKGNLSFEALKT